MKRGQAIHVFFLGLSCLVATCIGCTSTTSKIILPDLSSDIIRAFKSVKIRAYSSRAFNTGIRVSKGEFYTIIATGHVSTSYTDRPTVKHPGIGPERKLNVIINKRSQVAPPINATLASPVSGEISLVVDDFGFNPLVGYASWGDYYRDNKGSFQTTVIVWNTKDIDQILAFLNQIDSLNVESKVSEKLITQAHSLKASLAEAKTISAPVAKKKPEGSDSTSVSSSRLEAESTDILGVEIATSESVPQSQDPSPTLSEEKQPSTASKDLYSPLMLLLSPREGQIVSSSTIHLIGVVEDDSALKNVDITVNGMPITLKMERGITLATTELPSRFEFNEKIPIIVGSNQIHIRAEDTSGRIAEKLLTVQRVEAHGTVWAVIVGVNDYPRLPQLKYAVNDAQAFHAFLVDSELVKADNVFLVVNEQATLNTMRSILGTKLKKRARKGDRVIIYFAGHGATERDVNSPDGDGLEKYLLPYDADPDDLYATALPMREIAHILNRIQSDSLIFIADSCYSGASGGRTVSIGGIRSTLSDTYIDRIAGGKGRVILAASAANEVSMEDEELEHGIFTYYLIKGLKGVADYDGDGYVTVDEAYRYVSEEVPKATGQAQHPIKKGSVEGQLVLGVAM